MNSDLLTKWTAIITNIAVVIGLAFVGLEFRNNARAVEAERIDSFIQGSHDITALTIENGDLAEILYQAHASPSSLSVAISTGRWLGAECWWKLLPRAAPRLLRHSLFFGHNHAPLHSAYRSALSWWRFEELQSRSVTRKWRQNR